MGFDSDYSFSNGSDIDQSNFNGGGGDIDICGLETALDSTNDKIKQLQAIAEWAAAQKADGWRSSDIEAVAIDIAEARNIPRRKVQQAVEHGYDLRAGVQYEKDLQELNQRLKRGIGGKASKPGSGSTGDAADRSEEWSEPEWSLLDDRRGNLPEFPLQIFDESWQVI